MELSTDVRDGKHCTICKTDKYLLICRECSYIGCNRFHLDHALDHFIATSHKFAYDLKTSILWNLNDGQQHGCSLESNGSLLINTTGCTVLEDDGVDQRIVPEEQVSQHQMRLSENVAPRQQDELRKLEEENQQLQQELQQLQKRCNDAEAERKSLDELKVEVGQWRGQCTILQQLLNENQETTEEKLKKERSIKEMYLNKCGNLKKQLEEKEKEIERLKSSIAAPMENVDTKEKQQKSSTAKPSARQAGK